MTKIYENKHKVFSVIRQAIRFRPLVLLTILCASTTGAGAANEKSTAGVTNFAFASYLGTGFYTTKGQQVFVLQMPFEYVIHEKDQHEAGWLLKLPVTVGFINFSDIDFENLPEVPKLDDVGTLTFLPGLEYQHPLTTYWTISPFADYGFARDLNNTTNVLITGIGLNNTFEFKLQKNTLTLGNRILYAREQSRNSDNRSDYSLVETGINYSISTNAMKQNPLSINLYYIYFYYPNELVFFERAPDSVRVGHENEIGFTIGNIPDFLFFEKPQLGLGIRFGNNIEAYRIVFGMPF